MARQRDELALSSNLAHMEPLFNQEIQDALRTSGALRHRHERMELRNRTRAAAAAAANISIICAITSSPMWAAAPGSLPPNGRPSSPEAYGNFTAKVAERYKGRIAAFEIWNEPNGIFGYRPVPDRAGYTDLLKAKFGPPATNICHQPGRIDAVTIRAHNGLRCACILAV